MKVVLSSGLGRLHFFTSACALARNGTEVRLIGGWIPRCTETLFIKVLSYIVGYDLRPGFKRRQICEKNVQTVGLACADFLDRLFIIIFRKIFPFLQIDPIWGWKLFGWRSSKYLRGYSILHVRSGAGHGGAIKEARRLGLPVVVDHSIAHPAFMDKYVKSEYKRNGVKFDLGMESPFWRMVVEDCEMADILLVNSEFVKETFIEEGFPADKIWVVYLGVPEMFFGIKKYGDHNAAHELRLLFTGAFGFRKGGEYILQAAKILIAKGFHNFRIDFVGSTSQGTRIIEKFSDAHLPVHFHGPMSQENMLEFMRKADVYVFPSLAEGCAKSGMEAMAAGLCVVATRESGLPIENGVTGCLVPSKDAVALAEKIEWLANNPDQIEKMGVAAARLIKADYNEIDYAANLLNVYEVALKGST